MIFKITDQALTAAEGACGVERIEPVYGSNLSADTYHRLALPHFQRTDVLLAPSEVGTTLAHLAAYRRIVAAGVGAIILEADIHLDEPTLTFLHELVREHNAPFIHLGTVNRGKRTRHARVKPHASSLYLRDPRQRLEGTFAYYVSPEVARDLLAFHDRELRFADAWRDFFTSHSYEPLYIPVAVHGPPHGSNLAARHDRGSHWSIVRRLHHLIRHYLSLRWYRMTARLRGWHPDTGTRLPRVQAALAKAGITEPQSSSNTPASTTGSPSSASDAPSTAKPR